VKCKKEKAESLKLLYKFSNRKALVGKLAELTTQFNNEDFIYFVLKKNHMVHPIIQIENSQIVKLYPIFIKTFYGKHEVFFSTQKLIPSWHNKLNPTFYKAHFLQIAPLIIFLKYSYGNLCWHSPSHYANLTVDDPWLTEPYGNLSYKGLLEEIKKVNFHTSIAFTPWNFNRSKFSKIILINFRYVFMEIIMITMNFINIKQNQKIHGLQNHSIYKKLILDKQLGE